MSGVCNTGLLDKNEIEKGKSLTFKDLRKERGVYFHYLGVVEARKMKMKNRPGPGVRQALALCSFRNRSTSAWASALA